MKLSVHIPEEYKYDLWSGRRNNPIDCSYFRLDIPKRSYSGNGRVYDPVIGRFLSPDPLIQSPSFTQSYNSYSYCRNNPLKFVDPSGYNYRKPWWQVILDLFRKKGASSDQEKVNQLLEEIETQMTVSDGTYDHPYSIGFEIFVTAYGSSGSESSITNSGFFHSLQTNSGVIISDVGAPRFINSAKGVLAFMSSDIMVLEPSDTVLAKWIGYSITATAATIVINHYAGKGNAHYPGPWIYTIPDPTSPYYNPPKPPNFDPGNYDAIIKWTATLTLTARLIQKYNEIRNQPLYNTFPTDATRVYRVPVKPLQPDLP